MSSDPVLAPVTCLSMGGMGPLRYLILPGIPWDWGGSTLSLPSALLVAQAGLRVMLLLPLHSGYLGVKLGFCSDIHVPPNWV